MSKYSKTNCMKTVGILIKTEWPPKLCNPEAVPTGIYNLRSTVYIPAQTRTTFKSCETVLI
jgi:hypothetical protein